MKKIIVTFLAIAVLFSITGCGKIAFESSNEKKNYSIKYELKINPEFTVYANDELILMDITAENEEAKAVLDNIDVVGLSVNEGFTLITNEAQSQGYMTQEKGNTLQITILEKDEDKMPTCHVCGGSGTVMCVVCNGTGIACECERCNATGIIHFEAGPVCPHCAGSSVCSFCGGSGGIIVTNGEDGAIVYASDGVAETGLCPECFGSGVCANCHGGDYSGTAHDEICEGCQGTGLIYCHDDLNGYSWCPCCWGSGIDGTGDPNYSD